MSDKSMSDKSVVSMEEYPVEYIHYCGSPAFYANYTSTNMDGHILFSDDLINPDGTHILDGQLRLCHNCGMILTDIRSENLRFRSE